MFICFSLIKFNKNYQKNLAIAAMFGLMLIFSAIRGSGDADYYNYLWFAKDIGTDTTKLFDSHYAVEFSFRMTAFIVNLLGLSRQWVIAFMNLLSIGPISYVVAKKSRMPFLSALIFMQTFLQFDMQTSRTATAIGLGVLSIYLMTEEKNILSILAFIWAYSFHKSAVILLPFLIYLKFDLSNLTKSIIVGFSLVVSVFSKLLFGILAKVLGAVGLARMATKIINYTFEGQFAYAMKLYDPRIIFALALFVMTIMYFDKGTFKKNTIDSAAVKAVFYGLVVVLVFRSSTAIAFRFSSFFTVMQIFLIPLLIKEVKEKDSLAVFMLILAVLVFVLPYAVYIAVDAPPYDFFFTNHMAINSLR